MKGLLAAFVFASLGSLGCAEDPDVTTTNLDMPSFDDFVAATHQMEDGTWIVNGDEPLDSIEELEEFYWTVFGSGELIVNRVGNSDDVWSSSAVQNLTYCVSTRFRDDHDPLAAARERRVRARIE